jgi:hypothetical protein
VPPVFISYYSPGDAPAPDMLGSRGVTMYQDLVQGALATLRVKKIDRSDNT